MPLFGCAVKQNSHYEVEKFINYVKTDNRNELSKIASYPLKRPAPLPNITNKQKFIEYYDILFDADFINKIINSDPAKDWQAVGWRGITFGRGEIWLDYGGSLMAINHITPKELELVNYMSAKEKASIHASLKNFIRNELFLKTEKFIIRVDLIDESRMYRYAAWSVGKSISDKPDIIIKDGNIIYDGNGGNRYYEFKNGDYVYRINVNVIGTIETVPYELMVYKKDELILSEDAEDLYQ
jgi:hypothetical protein